MAPPRQPNSLRSLIRVAMLVLFAKGSHGPVSEIEKQIDVEGYHPNTLKVQVAQVRNDLLKQIGVTLPFQPKGRLSEAQKKTIEQRLKMPQFHKKAVELKAA